jgi:polyhydroxyalkanoate synthesis regulator phasin
MIAWVVWGGQVLDVYRINRDLMVIQGVMSSANTQLAGKKEELERLEKALANLKENKSNYKEQKDMCLDPEFTSQTLHGKNANQLDNLKKGDVQMNFVAIPNEQISKAESQFTTQMTTIKGEIASLESHVAAMESKQNQLTVQRQEVLNQS